MQFDPHRIFRRTSKKDFKKERGAEMKRGLSILIVTAALLLGVEPMIGNLDSQSSPRIISAKVKGKKLFVAGENFAPGATILINGQRQKTRNSESSSGEVLIAKKGGKRIPPDQAVILQVMNSDQEVSKEFPFFDGPTLTLTDNGKTVAFSVGERFLLTIDSNYEWTVAPIDQSLIAYVPTLIPIPGPDGFFEAVARGKTTIKAQGLPNCGKCRLQPTDFAVTIVID
jgi:hypothetical protein